MASDVTGKSGPLWKLPKRKSEARKEKDRLYGYRGRRQVKWQAFRNEYLKKHIRDDGGYLCMVEFGYGCGKWIEYPEVDHIIKRSVRPDLVFDESNLQILCNPCHRKKDGGMKV